MALTNRRTDKYGGDLKGRLTLSIEIINEIKNKTGADFPVQLRYSIKSFIKDWNQGGLPGEDFKEVGRDTEEGLEAARILEGAGYDAFNADTGSYEAHYWAYPPLYQEHGCYLPFKSETFDLITCLEVLEHVLQPARILKESFRCLKRGGHLVVLVPNNTLLFRIIWFFWTATWGKTWEDKHVYQFDRKSVQTLLAGNGMKVIDVQTFHLGMLTAVKAVKE